MSNTEEPKKSTSKEKKGDEKPSFLVEDQSRIEVKSKDGQQAIVTVDPSLRSGVKSVQVEGVEMKPAHPITEDKKPTIGPDGVLRRKIDEKS